VAPRWSPPRGTDRLTPIGPPLEVSTSNPIGEGTKTMRGTLNLTIAFCMNAWGSVEQTAYKAGHRHYQCHDANRQRPVWVDVWYPAKDEAEELPLHYELGQGSAAHNAIVGLRRRGNGSAS
jgi:hypothetical protein